ncbi:MAG: RNA polymerase sigma factor [Acholeplasmataceae bacterium]|nr:RNA polymerase sigma factor [Acholeplasmataceae bacterium]
MDQIHAIIEELKKRNYQSFDTFYNLTKNQVFYAIINIVKDQDLAEDIMQDTYVKFLEKIEQYKSGSNPYAYLSTIARNLAINTYNREKGLLIHKKLLKAFLLQKKRQIKKIFSKSLIY